MRVRSPYWLHLNQWQTMMKNLCTKTLLVVVVAVATVRSYLSLAAQSGVLPRHLA